MDEGEGVGVLHLISIHALREEGDGKAIGLKLLSEQFLSTPSARRATDRVAFSQIYEEFLSTPSARRATFNSSSFHKATLEFLSTPSARRATSGVWSYDAVNDISIHALREEGDNPAINILLFVLEFLSTPSARRATDYLSMYGYTVNISIHALREEGDQIL